MRDEVGSDEQSHLWPSNAPFAIRCHICMPSRCSQCQLGFSWTIAILFAGGLLRLRWLVSLLVCCRWHRWHVWWLACYRGLPQHVALRRQSGARRLNCHVIALLGMQSCRNRSRSSYLIQTAQHRSCVARPHPPQVRLRQAASPV